MDWEGRGPAGGWEPSGKAGALRSGQHWLNVKFANSLARAPFRILTKEEYTQLDKNDKDIEKQVEDAFNSPRKD